MPAAKPFLLLAYTLIAVTAMAQDPTRPRLRATTPAPLEEPKLSQTTDSIGLIPETIEPVKKPKGEALKEPSEKVDRTTAAENEMASRVRLRELINKVRQEPKVAGEWDRAQTAKTDFDKREALKSYYKALYERVVKLDPSLDRRVAELRAKSLHRLAETRIDPTEPIDPTERGNRQD